MATGLRMTMSTRNLRGVVANFHALDKRAQRGIRKVVGEAGIETHDLAVALAPFDTGFLQDHIRLRFTEKGLGYEVGWEEQDFLDAGYEPYFIYTEFGTTKMPAQPCLFPAHEHVRPRFLRNLRQELRAAIARRR